MGILVIGDVMLDKYWYSEAESLANEAPILNVNISDCQFRAGGAANVALNIANLSMPGIPISMFSVIGDDEHGNILSQLLVDHGVITDFVIDKSKPTITKHRIISNKKQLVRVDFEEQCSPVELTPELKSIINKNKVIVISDYNKGCLSQAEEIIAYTKQLNKIILVDPKGSDFTKYHGATLITPNLKEFINVVGECSSQEQLNFKAKQLIENINLDYLLVTQGANGMTLFAKNGKQFHACSYAEEVFDVTGAGDTVLASIAVDLYSDVPPQDTIERASHAAALVVGQLGTGFVTRDQVNSAEKSNKLLNLDYENITTNIESNIVNISDNNKLNEVAEYLSKRKNIVTKLWDAEKDNVLNAESVSKILEIKKTNSNIQLVLIMITPDDCSRLVHQPDELAYMLSSIKKIDKVIYSLNMDISDIYHSQQVATVE